IPYTISGPPGTGKTKTLVEATLQILRRQPDANILLCAPSNSAADTLTKRLTRTLKPQEMFRLNAPERTFAEVPEEILLYCHITSMNGNEEEEGGGDLRPTLQEPVIALCGDTAQLGPMIHSHQARSGGLDLSLLDRLTEREDGGGDRGDPPPICSQLVRNYRSGHASLLMIPSNLFYSDLLIPCAKPTERIKGWKGLPNREVAIYFDNVKGKDIWVDEGVSWYNQAEINRIVEIIKSLTAAFEEEEEEEKVREIAVMTPFNEQVWRLRLALRGKGLGSVNVGPIEAFQGSEHSVSILSTVRSRARFLERDMERGLGLIFESKRFCVSITRAKEALIVVGDGEMLKVDPYWRVFLETCLRNR
ncbi:P-loop containing nucleoside triphosphate hydrolase protein, partial [Violaceomyces palustris]